MIMIKTDLKHARICAKEFNNAELTAKIEAAHKKIRTNSAVDSTVWVELPNLVTDNEIKKIQETAAQIRKTCDVLFVIGVGGSFAGAFAAQQWLGNTFPVEYIGTSFDPNTLNALLIKYKDKKICVNVVSKSGMTLEIIAAFNAIAKLAKQIIVTTSANRGYLREYANKHNLQSFTILDGVGGRYSVLGAVGYLPLAVAGADIMEIHKGARKAYQDLLVSDLDKNEAYRYAAARYLLHKKAGKNVEVLASFFDGLEGLGRWWQQLFGESEGKAERGLFPVPLVYSRDLHSMGQYVQQGSPKFFETLIDVVKNSADVVLDTTSTDSMLCVPTASLAAINRAAFSGTVKAHADAGVPVVLLRAEKLDASGFGYLLYFFEISCAMSAFLLGVNPFDQPGVEFYKKNMRDELKM